MKIRYVLFFLIFSFLFSCRNIKEKSPLISYKTNVSGDSLVIAYDNSLFQFITPEGDLNNYLISSDSNMIVVNSTPLSNISISQVYLVKTDGYFDMSKPINLSSIVWDSISVRDGFFKENVVRSLTRAIGWDESNQNLKVIVSGQLENGNKISEEILIDNKKIN